MTRSFGGEKYVDEFISLTSVVGFEKSGGFLVSRNGSRDLELGSSHETFIGKWWIGVDSRSLEASIDKLIDTPGGKDHFFAIDRLWSGDGEAGAQHQYSN